MVIELYVIMTWLCDAHSIIYHHEMVVVVTELYIIMNGCVAY